MLKENIFLAVVYRILTFVNSESGGDRTETRVLRLTARTGSGMGSEPWHGRVRKDPPTSWPRRRVPWRPAVTSCGGASGTAPTRDADPKARVPEKMILQTGRTAFMRRSYLWCMIRSIASNYWRLILVMIRINLTDCPALSWQRGIFILVRRRFLASLSVVLQVAGLTARLVLVGRPQGMGCLPRIA